MPQIDTYPYLTFDQNLIQTEDWYLGESGRERVMPTRLNDWDPLTDLLFSRTLTIDANKIFAQCGLSEGAKIAVTASWHSAGTGIKECASSFELRYGALQQPVNFGFQVPGSKLAGSVELFTRVVLKQKGEKDSQLAPSRLGSILWQDEHSMRIEGFGARFPMEFADFSEHGYPKHAGWRLFWKKDFNAQVMGSICLLVNREHERLRGLASAAIHDPQSPAILETIHFAVARELIVGGVESDEFVEEPNNFPKGSVGEAICLLIRRVFGDETPDAVRQIYRSDPDRFDCQLQHAFRLFHPPAPKQS